MMIFQSSTHADRIVVALTLKDESGVEIIVPFTLDKQKEWMQANIITSVYGKGSDGHPKYQWYINQIKDGRLLYINKEKAAQFLTSAGVQFPMEEQTSSFITYSIKTYEDLVKLQEEKKEELKMAEEMNRIHENQTSEKIGEVLSNPPMPEDDFMAAYYKEIADSIVEAEPPMPEEVADGLWKSAANLRQSMDEFEEAEEKCGPNIETWENYAPQHQEILAHIEKAGEAYREDKSHEERTQAVETARGTMESSKAFFEAEREKLIEREKAYQEQIAAMQKEIETLKKETQQISPEAMAKCLATAMQFMQEVEKTRAAAVDQPRVVSSELFASTRKAVKDAYFSVKLAPSKIKALCQMLWLHSIGCIRSSVFLCRRIAPLSLHSLFYPFRIIQKEQNPALEVFKVAKPVRQPLECLDRRIAALSETIVETSQTGVQQFFFPCQCGSQQLEERC